VSGILSQQLIITVVSINLDLTLLDPNVVMKLLHHPPLSREKPLNSKTTFLVKYISGKTNLVGQIAACVFTEYFHQ
jgi:hypothetical protein